MSPPEPAPRHALSGEQFAANLLNAGMIAALGLLAAGGAAWTVIDRLSVLDLPAGAGLGAAAAAIYGEAGPGLVVFVGGVWLAIFGLRMLKAARRR
ncbi:MAG TPA: hypothetical protein VEA15_07570 [Caulobacteraceae bacterium]|nr:hypothetical protein [Caulobacteraceae bacterium]